METKPTRHFGLDILRVLACYMVVQIHTGEFFYIGDKGAVLNTPDAHVVAWYNSLFRICVPLFVMLSGYFLFPVGDINTFFKKRMSRVAVPFVIWCALYALQAYLKGGPTLSQFFINILKIPANYGVEVGHLWFVYMLLGLYLFAPVMSAWVVSATRKNMEFYLVLWCISSCIPYIHLYTPQIWGEAFWNNTEMLYYFSGFMGYVVLANYIKRFHLQPKAWNYSLGSTLIIVGYAITVHGFLYRLPTEKTIDTLELTWGFETINVAMMTAGVFLIAKNIYLKAANPAFAKVISDISAKSYGIYLAHIMVLNLVYPFYKNQFETAVIKIPLVAITTFIATYIGIKLLSYLPKSKWLIG